MFVTRNRNPDERAKSTLEFIHLDLEGPIEPVSRSGYRWVLGCADDFSGIICPYFMKNKCDTLETFKMFVTDTRPHGEIKSVRSVNTMVVNLLLKHSETIYVKTKSSQNFRHLIRPIKMVLLKECGEHCLTCQGACLLIQNYQKNCGLMPPCIHHTLEIFVLTIELSVHHINLLLFLDFLKASKIKEKLSTAKSE